jgi:hypothetical protein
MLRKLSYVGAALVGAFVAFRAFQAVRQGVSVLSALRHPTLPVNVAELADHPERQQTRSGAGHFA